MAQAILPNALPTFPVGTEVDAYLDFLIDAGYPRPIGPPVDSAVVAEDGSLSFGALPLAGSAYYAAAKVGGEWRSLRFVVEAVGEGESASAAGSPLLDAREFVGLVPSALDVGPKLQTAIERAHEYGMTLILPPWQLITAQTLIYHERQHIRGHGRTSGIKLGDNSDVDVLRPVKFDEGGAYNFLLEDFDVDGNEANNAAGNGIVVDGVTFNLSRLFVHHCAEVGVVGKKSSELEGNEFGYMDAWVDEIKSFLNGQAGFAWEGPHDSHWSNCIAVSNHGDGFRFFGEGFASKVYACHAYGDHDYGFRLEASIKAVNCESEGAAKAEVALFEDNVHWLGGTVFQDQSSATEGKVGFQFGRSVGEGGERSAFNTLIIGARINDCTNGAFKLVNGFGGTRILAYVYATEGTAFTGAKPTRGQIDATLHLQGGVKAGIDTPIKLVNDAGTSESMNLWVAGEPHPRVIILADGTIKLGNGEEPADTTIARDGKEEMKLPGLVATGPSEFAKVATFFDEAKFDDALVHSGWGVGFFGAPPVTKRAVKGAAAGNVALENLLAALVELGLIVDETT